jgi:hypothetical protein
MKKLVLLALIAFSFLAARPVRHDQPLPSVTPAHGSASLPR